MCREHPLHELVAALEQHPREQVVRILEVLAVRLRRQHAPSDRAAGHPRQVASLEVEGGPPPARTAEALYTALPPDVAVVAAREAAPGFDARFSARARSYR